MIVFVLVWSAVRLFDCLLCECFIRIWYTLWQANQEREFKRDLRLLYKIIFPNVGADFLLLKQAGNWSAMSRKNCALFWSHPDITGLRNVARWRLQASCGRLLRKRREKAS